MASRTKRKRKLPPMSPARQALFQQLGYDSATQELLHGYLCSTTPAELQEMAAAWGLPLTADLDAWGNTLLEKRDAAINASVARIRQTLEILEPLRREVKRRAMIYQCEWKEAQAMAEGKSHDAYHNLSYVEWAKIRDSRYG